MKPTLAFFISVVVLTCQQMQVPVRAQQTCYDQIADIHAAEAAVTDTSIQRTYVLCPASIFEIGLLSLANFDLLGVNTQPPLPLRPNMKIQCGESGARSNLCWLAEGDLQMDGTKTRGISDDTLDNIVIEGVVFIAARTHGVWANKPGSITFRDCEFRDFSEAVAPVFLDWYDADNENSKLQVTFEDCEFKSNTFFGRGSHTALIYATGAQIELTLRRTMFHDNDMLNNNTLADTNSYLVESLGPMTVEESCFTNNKVGVSNTVVFGNRFVANNNYVADSAGQVCNFASVFEDVSQFDSFSPLCITASELSCRADGSTASPTAFSTPTPTSPPTVPMPTLDPSLVTQAPVSSPSDIRDAPTLQPNQFSFPPDGIESTEAPAPSRAGKRYPSGDVCFGVAMLVVTLQSALSMFC